MNFNEYREELFKCALANGCSAAQTRFTDGEDFQVAVIDGDIERFTASHDIMLTLRVKLDGKDGYASTQVFEDAEKLVRRAMDNARTIEVEDESPMTGKHEYAEIAKPTNRLDALSAAEKIELAKKLEQAVITRDDEVKRVGMCEIASTHQTLQLQNTLGLDAAGEFNYSLASAEAVAKRGEQEKNAYTWKRIDAEELDMDAFATEVIAEAKSQLDGAPVASGEYRILLRNDTFGDLLEAMSDIFTAEAAQKGLSLLAGREGEVVATEKLTIMDDPFYADFARAFDDEGMPGTKKAVVENGVLKTLLHSLKTAKKAGCESTGNGTGTGVAPTNFYVVPGEVCYDDMVKQLGNGLIITGLAGLHAGLNAVSGDFSLMANGFLVEGGKVVRSVDSITVAGSFFELLKDIELIGSDLRFGFPGSMSRCGAPSVIISKLQVAGE